MCTRFMEYPSPLVVVIALLATAAIVADHPLLRIIFLGTMIVLAGVAFPLPFGRPEARSLLQRARSRLIRLSCDRLRISLHTRRSPDPSLLPTPRSVIVHDLLRVFLIALVVRCIWAVVVPPWQAPDEPDHYVYVAHIVEQDQIPHPPFAQAPYYSKEVTTSWATTFLGGVSGVGTSASHDLPYFPVAHDYRTARDYEAPYQDRLSSAGARATPYPPLYYLLEAVPYRLFQGAPLLSRLFAMRLVTATLGALSCVFAYLMAYELRRQRRWGWTLGLCMALMPMYVFTTSTVNNDVAMVLGSTALIWLTVRAWQQQALSCPLAFAIGLVSGLTLLTKFTMAPVVVIAGVVVLIKVFPAIRTFLRHMGEKALTIGTYAAGTLITYGPWALFRLHYYGNIGVGMISFPTLFRFVSGATPVAAAPHAVSVNTPTAQTPLLAASSLWTYLQYTKDGGWDHYHWLLVRSFWGNFGWLDAPMPNWVFGPIGIFYLIGIAGLAIQLILQPARRRGFLLLLSLVVAQAFFLFVILGYWESSRIGADIGLQGRYFFPILAPLLFLLLSGWDHLCGEYPLALRLAPYLMLALNLVGLATLLSRYYGVTIG